MLKFKRLNVLKRVKETGESYSLHNLIRQTTLEYLMTETVLKDYDKERAINLLLFFIKEDLEKMLQEGDK